MLPILDLQYFQDMNLDYGSAIQALNELVGVIMVQNLGNKRTRYVIWQELTLTINQERKKKCI